MLPKKENNDVGGSINTRQSFGDVKVHLEFRLPYEPEHRGQKRANSGFFLPGGYEVQILDSYGLDGMWNECGALYKQSPPRVNMCWAPGVWQTFDVEFKRLRRDSEGNKIDDAEFTVWHNGVKIHNSFQIKGTTSNTQKGRGLAESGKNGGYPSRITAIRFNSETSGWWSSRIPFLKSEVDPLIVVHIRLHYSRTCTLSLSYFLNPRSNVVIVIEEQDAKAAK